MRLTSADAAPVYTSAFRTTTHPSESSLWTANPEDKYKDMGPKWLAASVVACGFG